MEHGGPDARAADAQSDGRDTHVLDRGVGEEALVVVRAAQEERADRERQHADDEQHGADPREDLRGGENPIDAQYGQEAGIDQPRGDERRGGRRRGEVGIDAHGVEREKLDLAAVSAEDQQEGGLQVEGVAARGRGGDRFVGKRFAFGGGGQQQDAQIGHGDARRADEDVFPRRFERLRRAAVVDDACRAERRGFEEDPRHGQVRGEIGSGDGRGEEHQERRVGARLPQVAAVQVGFGVGEGEGRDHDEQDVEKRAGGVEGEDAERVGAVEFSGEDAEDEDGLNGVECGARGGDLPLVAGREGRRGGQNACDQVEEHHGVSPLRW